MAAQPGRQEAYCTVSYKKSPPQRKDELTQTQLLLSDGYLPGAMVLGHSLRDHGTKKQLVAFVTLDSLQTSTLDELKRVYDQIIPVDRVVNKSPANLYLMNRPDLISTFTKIALWRQTQFHRLLYIDADVVALRAPDELFNIEAKFAAVPDIGWPDCFNSGVLYLKPDMGDYYALLALAQRGISFDGADQGLLNTHFRNWHRLSFTYNCTPSGNYQYVPAYRHFQSSISLVHYIGREKPWTVERNGRGATGMYEELLGWWWSVYDKHYRAAAPTYGSTQLKESSRSGQQHVRAQATSEDFGYSSFDPDGEEYRQPEVPVSSAEVPLTEQPNLGEIIGRKVDAPVPTVQQRRYSAEWDPIREPPPAHSRPEASNFPSNIYQMSEDPSLFQPPIVYPEPPKNMYYQIPESAPAEERLEPIFPWESYQQKPVRVFADELLPASPIGALVMASGEDQKPLVATEVDENKEAPVAVNDEDQEPPVTVADNNRIPSVKINGGSQTPSIITDYDDEEGAEEDKQDTVTPTTPTEPAKSLMPFASYSRTNAWDEIPEIELYIANLSQKRFGKIQILAKNSNSPDGVSAAETSQKFRRPSMKLTDFPTEIERPSLPVTPAPVRRPSFWGEGKDPAAELPGAQGVPDQAEWDPIAKLEELKCRQSEVLAQGPTGPMRPIPDRQLPESAAPALAPEEQATMPSFGDVDYSPSDKVKIPEKDTLLSPVEALD